MLVPESDIVAQQNERGEWAATSSLLPDCESAGQTEDQARAAFQKVARAHLIRLRDLGEPLPEPFQSAARRNRVIAVICVIFIGLAPAVILRLFVDPAELPQEEECPIDPDKAQRVRANMSAFQVVQLLGKPKKKEPITEHDPLSRILRGKNPRELWTYPMESPNLHEFVVCFNGKNRVVWWSQ